ncbi:amino acid ABC transporter permease, partial [Roseibium sp. RKSG952]|nr:amino acid ABC transporter permease [Roseibium sp. RKSG952]
MQKQQEKQDFPYWLLAAVVIAGCFFYQIAENELYSQVMATVSKGAGITIFVTLAGFALASMLGLLLAVASLSRFLFLRQAARFYIEIVRGLPDLPRFSGPL